MIGDTAALACAVLAIVRRDGAPPDPKNNAAVRAGTPNGGGNLAVLDRAKKHQQGEHTRYRVAVAIILTWGVVTAADAYSARSISTYQGRTSPAYWRCWDACAVAGREP